MREKKTEFPPKIEEKKKKTHHITNRSGVRKITI